MIDLATVVLKRNFLSNKKSGNVAEGSSNDTVVANGTAIGMEMEPDIVLKNLRQAEEDTNEDLGLASTGFQKEAHVSNAEFFDLNKKPGAEITEQTHESQKSLIEVDTDDSLILDNDREFPDGGLRAWSVVFGSFMGLIPVFGVINSLGAIE